MSDVSKVKVKVASKPSPYAKQEIERMYKELTDDDVIAENKRRFDRDKRLQDKISDTGL